MGKKSLQKDRLYMTAKARPPPSCSPRDQSTLNLNCERLSVHAHFVHAFISCMFLNLYVGMGIGGRWLQEARQHVPQQAALHVLRHHIHGI